MFYLLIAVFLYFIPAVVAGNRGHRNALAIFMMNLFLGWTFLGWVMSLVWACTSNVQQRRSRKVRREPELAKLRPYGYEPRASLLVPEHILEGTDRDIAEQTLYHFQTKPAD